MGEKISIAELRQEATDAFEWNSDFRDGRFHVHCHKCGAGEPYLPPEFFGLVKESERFAPAILALLEAVEAAQKRIEAAETGSADDCYDAMEALKTKLARFDFDAPSPTTEGT